MPAYNQATLQNVGYNNEATTMGIGGGFTGGASVPMDANFSAHQMLYSQRRVELEYQQSYYRCEQHDGKTFDFDGRVIEAGNPKRRGGQPLLNSEKAPYYVPLRQRRPNTPYRLAKVIVDAFSGMTFGEHRFPHVEVIGDPDSQDWLETFMRTCGLPQKMSEARSIGGAVGTVGLSWCFVDGVPRIDVHNGKHLYVHSWKDRVELIPEVVSEIYTFEKDEWDQSHGCYMKVPYWYHRIWTEDSDIVFFEQPYVPGVEPEWIEDWDRSYNHNDGFCHLIWVQNFPSEDIDGQPDYDGLYEKFDSIDVLLSTILKGAIVNLDPTLVLKMDPDYVDKKGIKKGSENALCVGETGNASYLELVGTSITVGLALFRELRASALEVAQCVIADPNQLAAQGMSSLAIKAIYAPMLSKTNIYRGQYGKGIQRLLCQVKTAAQKMTYESPEIVLDDDGTETVITPVIKLEPKVVEKPVLDEVDGTTLRMETTIVERKIGLADDAAVKLNWPEYFLPTPDEQNKIVATVQTASGGKAVMSQETAIEEVAKIYGRDYLEETKKIKAVEEQEAKQRSELLGGDMGGKVDSIDQLPYGSPEEI